MTTYFFLIISVLFIPLACSGIQSKKTRNQYTLLLSIIAVFLIMALKAPSVGRDIISYKNLYEAMEFRSWENYNISWMESGYELLTMVFVRVFHASFQTFMACVYAFLYFSYYVFFKRYSMDYTTSVLLYICFTFFTFDTSAVRTMLGVAICLFAVPYAEKKGIKNALVFFAITLFAAQIHRSAYIFFAVYFVIKYRFSLKTAIFYVGIPALLLLYKGQLYRLISLYFKSVEESDIEVGGNMLVYVTCLVLTIVIWFVYDRRNNDEQAELQPEVIEKKEEDNKRQELTNYFNTTALSMRMIYVGLVVLMFSTGSVLARMAQYMLLFVLILVPNNIARLNTRSRVILKWILYIFAIIYFWRFSLMANALDIVPYKTFWNA